MTTGNRYQDGQEEDRRMATACTVPACTFPDCTCTPAEKLADTQHAIAELTASLLVLVDHGGPIETVFAHLKAALASYRILCGHDDDDECCLTRLRSWGPNGDGDFPDCDCWRCYEPPAIGPVPVVADDATPLTDADIPF
jgi:hypothetical protein